MAGWLEAFATVAALAAATTAGVFTARALRIEQARDETLQAQHRSEQASRVAAWHTRFDVDDADGTPMLSGAYVRLRNASDLPVYRLTLQASVLWPTQNGHMARTEAIGQDIDVLPPQEPADGLKEPRLAVPAFPRPAGARVEVQLSFVDAAGQRWTRLADGQLIEG